MLINMDKRKKKTSVNQYTMYLQMLEDDEIFRTGVLPDNVEISYIPRRWKELTNKLNTCDIGPQLTPGQWKKRLMDWKHTTRSKYRRSSFKPAPGKSKIVMSSLEKRAINLWGKPTPTEIKQEHANFIKLKSETSDHFVDDTESYNLVTSNNNNLTKVLDQVILTPKHANISHEEVEIDEIEEPELTDNNFYDDTGDKEDPKNTSKLIEAQTISVFDVQHIGNQLKRIADIKDEKLRFEIAKFKFRNPGFEYD